MDLDFGTALERLGPNAPVRIAREARVPGTFVFNSFLPERTLSGYVAEHGNMTIRSTMAGLTGMDAPYPPGGFTEASDFMARLPKVANEVTLHERTQREIQERVRTLQLGGGDTIGALVNEVLNFMAKAIVQPHHDTAEWLRGQALVYGEIDWTFNDIRIQVDYGIPTDNFLPERTAAEAYDGADSLFWEDVRALRRLLRYNLREIVAHPDTIDVIVNNPNNNLAVLNQAGFDFTVQRQIPDTGSGGSLRPSTDARDTITLRSYDAEGEMLNPAAPNETIIVPFMPQGKLLAIGRNERSGYRVGEGSTPDPEADRALGYTHIGPTVEGGGVPGRWADSFTPERKRYQLVGQGVSNLIPVIEAPHKIAVATTAMP